MDKMFLNPIPLPQETNPRKKKNISSKQILQNKYQRKINRGRQVKTQKAIVNLIPFQHIISFDDRGKRNGNCPTQPLKLGRRLFVQNRSCFYSHERYLYHYEMLMQRKNRNVRRNQKAAIPYFPCSGFHHPLPKLENEMAKKKMNEWVTEIGSCRRMGIRLKCNLPTEEEDITVEVDSRSLTVKIILPIIYFLFGALIKYYSCL